MLAGPQEAPLIIRQNVWLYAAVLKNESLKFEVPEGQIAYAVAIQDIQVNSVFLNDGDGIKIKSGSIQVEGTGQLILLTQDSRLSR